MTGTALTSYQERFAADAQALAAREARGGTNISTRGGVFSVGGEAVGNKLIVIVLDSYFANEYHDKPFDPDAMTSPICYAFDRQKNALSPHVSMQADLSYFKPQHFPCQGCPKNEWGSAAVGKGKACKNKEKLAVIPAGYVIPAKGRTPSEMHLHEQADHFAAADVAILSVPVMSGENWSKYVSQLSTAHQRPPYAVYTEIALVPDPKTQYKMHFEFLDLCPDDLFDTIVQRVDAQLAQPFPGYTAPTPEQLAPRSAAGQQRGFGR